MSTFLILLIPFVLCTNTTYFSIRVAKSLGAILRDNLILLKQASDTIAGTKIHDITSIRDDSVLRLVDIEVTVLVVNEENLEVKRSGVTDEGSWEVGGEGKGLRWVIRLKWIIESDFTSSDGTVDLETASHEFVFKQEYKKGNVHSYFDASWSIEKFDCKGTDAKEDKEWIRNVTNTILLAELAPIVNKTFDSISNELVKPHEIITVNNKEEAVIIRNKLLSGNKGFHKERAYVILNFGAEISAANKPYKHVVNTSLFTAFDSTREKFDYEVCFSSKLFGEYMDFLIRAGYRVYDKVSTEGYHKYINFYKRIINGLGNQYSDDEKIKIILEPNFHKDFGYLAPDMFLIPIVLKLAVVKDKKLILTLNAVFRYHYEIIETKERHIVAILRKGVVHRLETIPNVGYQSRFAATELAESFAGMLGNYTIGKPDGFFVSTMRPDSYKLGKVEMRPEETCFLYTDKEA